ncbi:MAG: trypsin-like serine protease [Gammaproteobacteria bacterium]|nr:trypsin-like serine protease [Gammaproteobacteria bacterium]|tara:strand:+ start:620 stop:1687 length:1068 start_codon:yes stop_codon:yes gene_type:complete
MREIRGYIIVGIITAVIIYMISPYMFGNRVQIKESSTKPLQNKAHSYADVFKKVNKSVVSIYTRKSTTSNNVYFIDPRKKALIKKDYSPSGQGSGVIVSNQGHVITNFHVIAGSDEILIRDYNGNEYGTAIIGIDPLTDLAILKINKSTIPITLGKIENINIGDIALAIGNPLGVGQTITLGIISATDKEVTPNAYAYQRYVQTDAAINPGNSGGALVNSNGELIGINTAIISISGGADGIGFAIPIDIAKNVISEIIENGEVIRGYVGISAEPNYRGIGILVNGVVSNSPADKAGIRANDIIKKVNNISVTEIKEIQKIIGMVRPGQNLSMYIQRNKNIMKVNVLVSKMDYKSR